MAIGGANGGVIDKSVGNESHCNANKKLKLLFLKELGENFLTFSFWSAI